MGNSFSQIRCLRAFGGLRACLLVFAAWLLLAVTASAEPVNRRILAIYDSGFEPSPDATLIHSKAEMPLNHLGYVLEYRDAAQGLPEPGIVSNYAAVLTWFTYDVTRPSAYLAWARRVSEGGVPFIILGQVGGPASSDYLPSINRLLAPMGIAYTPNFVESTSGTTVVVEDKAVVGFEHGVGGALSGYPVIRRMGTNADVLLELQAPERERRVRSAVVIAGPRGALVASGFALYVDPVLGRTQWIVNPFALFRKVLGKEPFPVPDTTTVSGRRLYYSLVDGDGWNDDVEIDRYQNPPAIAAEVLASELVEAYPDLPVTVALIGSDTDPAFGNGERAAAVARRLFALPQVEVASHTATSPQDWSFYENYSRAEEERLMGGPKADERVPGWLSAAAEAFGIVQAPSEIERNRTLYLSGARGLPRAYLRDPFSLESEVSGAAETARALAPEGKPAAIYSWTGDARPFAAAIGATRMAGLRNIGGGGAQFDPQHPSIAEFRPIARGAGTERQIYLAGSFSDNAAGPASGPSAFARSSAMREATENPARLTGVGLYYHAFAAKRLSSLKAVRDQLNWARNASLAPITTSQYASIADGFFSTRIERVGAASWRVSARDGLQTVRFDDAGGRDVDVAASVGVVGGRHYQGSLYVALDAAVPEALVVLRTVRSEASKAPTALAAAQLDEAGWMVRDVVRDECRLTFSANGFGAASLLWKDVGQRDYHLSVKSGADTVWQAKLASDQDGVLRIDLPELGARSLTFTADCADRSPEKSS